MKKYAEDNGIALQYIPAGQTGKWQPLDFRIFANLKARAKAAFDEQNVVAEDGTELTINLELAIYILMHCYDEIPLEEIMNACTKLEGETKLISRRE